MSHVHPPQPPPLPALPALTTSHRLRLLAGSRPVDGSSRYTTWQEEVCVGETGHGGVDGSSRCTTLGGERPSREQVNSSEFKLIVQRNNA